MSTKPETEARLDRIEHPTAPPTDAETDRGPSVDPQDSADPNEGASLFGVFYPKYYIVAVFGSDAEAASAGTALAAAGFAEGDIRTWAGADVVAHHDAYAANRSFLQKAGSLLPSEEHDIQNDYLEQARAGATLLTVLAREEGQRQTAAPIIADHQGALMRYYGDNTITNLTLDDRSNG